MSSVEHEPSETPLHLAIRDVRAKDRESWLRLRQAPDQWDNYFLQAEKGRARFLIIEAEGKLVGFGLLFFKQPIDDTPKSALPMMSDLQVAAAYRSRGIGTALIRHMETLVRERGRNHLYVGVDPVENTRALDLYLRLGYRPVQREPYLRVALYYDENGSYEVRYWRIDLVKRLK